MSHITVLPLLTKSSKIFDLHIFIKIVGPHPVISSKKMSFCIFLRSACEFRLEMTPNLSSVGELSEGQVDMEKVAD